MITYTLTVFLFFKFCVFIYIPKKLIGLELN